MKQANCIEWTGAVQSSGYGALRVGGKVVLAHRHAYQKVHGDIPKGLVVMHSCDNRLCVNPAHLSAGTSGDNNLDRMQKGKHPRALTKDKVILARALDRYGVSRGDIAKTLACHKRTISDAIVGKTWAWLT